MIPLAAAGAGLGAFVCYRTKRLREKARRRGGHVPRGPYEAVIKRPLEAFSSSLALVVLSPLFAATALLVRIKLGSPVFFVQKRPGLDGKLFPMIKFRTMTDGRDIYLNLLADEQRLTAFGRILRSTSLDELPELLNVVRGDMAITGPRPLLAEYLPRYNERQKRRHDVRPGITGLAQVSGRNSLSWEEKFEEDLRYVENITFLNDLKILSATCAVVFRRDGIHAQGSATMPEFLGNASDR